MKLSKKNQARQRAIRKAIASGKSVGGLLAGALALATTGCSPRPSPGPIGRFPDRRYEEQAGRKANNEKPKRSPTREMPRPITEKEARSMHTIGIPVIRKPPQKPNVE
jgi:hypothetical protein